MIDTFSKQAGGVTSAERPQAWLAVASNIATEIFRPLRNSTHRRRFPNCFPDQMKPGRGQLSIATGRTSVDTLLDT